MHIIKRRGWEISERLVTPEEIVLKRRSVLGGLGAIGAGLIGGGTLMSAHGARAEEAKAAIARNPKYLPERELTAERAAETYNNYYEFGEDKSIWREAQALKLRPWSISIEGMVANPRRIDIDDLLKQVSLEERVYRHRCVEAWAMTVPWTGFALSELLRLAEPLGSAKFVVFETVQDKSMPNIESPLYPWPYIEALTIDEAGNELAFISTGLFGKPLPPQNGAPIRLTTPWKYGFKSGKALGRVSFVEKRPTTFWEAILPNEYGFWANVNPDVPHPRWSQASERLLGTNDTVPTRLYNGYGPFVASLYSSRQNEKLFM